MKCYTDLNQSRTLAEILPLASADFHFSANQSPQGYLKKPIWGNPEYANYNAFPCWSLAALLDVLPYPTLAQHANGLWSLTAWVGTVETYSVEGCDNKIDACYEMILKLHEQNVL